MTGPAHSAAAGPAGVDRAAVNDALREVIARERARVDDPGAAVLGADPDDGHGWHSWDPDTVTHPREPGVPLFHPECWRFFRLLDLLWLDDVLIVAFAWDELGTPDLRYLTQVRFMAAHLEHGDAKSLALTARGHLRHLLAPSEDAVSSLRRVRAPDLVSGREPERGWRERCGRLWLDRDHVLVTPGEHPDQETLDRNWDLPWPSLTNPR